jgi:hypothetical protein
MSRFDDEMIKQAENAFQERGLSGTVTTPRQQPYDQINTVGTDSAPGVTQAPAPAEEMADWVANTPAMRQVDVRDLDAADEGEIVGGPGSSEVLPEGQRMYASTINPIDESLYNVYKASRDIREAIDSEVDFDFNKLAAAANDAATVVRFASANGSAIDAVGTVAGIVSDIENDLVTYGDYRQASADLQQLEGLLEDINKFASKFCKTCKGKGCEECEDDGKCTCDGKGECKACKKASKKDKKKKNKKKAAKEATNGNQETLQVVDVRDLDDAAGVFDRQRVMTPDHQTNTLVPEAVNGEDAGYVNYYNDGAETGIVPQQGPHHQQLDFNDATNPALAPYGAVAGAVQASREKIFEALQVVERLEKLGMVQHDDRAKHIAKFEQMSDSKLAGFKASLDMLEESGARQPRSQKVASGANRLPEMGRLTTASTASRQDIASDDWLMTLN